jgi:hypothetical protein
MSADFISAVQATLLCAADMSDSVGATATVIIHSQDVISDPGPTSSPQSVIEAPSSASADMFPLTTSGSALMLRPAAAASAFPFQATATGAQRAPKFVRRRKDVPCGRAETRGRSSLGRPQPRPTEGSSRLGLSSARCGATRATAALLLCVSWTVSVASAQQALCSSAWSTAALSVNRGDFATAEMPNQGFAIFAGGYTGP